MKKITSFFVFILVSFLLISISSVKTVADDASSINDYINSYVQDGLVSLYSGLYNTKAGHNESSTKWENLVGTNSITLTTNSTNMFNSDSFHLASTKQYFTNTELNTVNGNEFSLEFLLSDFTPLGSSFNTFINSANDNFALFRRVSSGVLEFKFAGVAQANRPTVSDSISFLDYSLIGITYKVGGNVKIYVNGELKAEKACSKAMGADNLFFGHSESTRNFEIDYKLFRFYNRELTSDEILKNAKADDMYGVGNKVTHYNTIALNNTNIIGGLTAIQRINNYSEIDSALSKTNKPSALIYKLDKNLNLVLNDKTDVTLLSVLEKCNDTVIPVFDISDEETANKLSTFIKGNKYFDSFVMSSDSSLVKLVRSKVSNIYGCIDYQERLANKESLSKADLVTIRSDMHSNNGTVAILPVNLCTHENVQYLYDSIVNVWCETKEDTDSLIYQGIACGAIGVISPNADKVIKIAKENFKANSMTRLPLNIGHRGIPNAAPENTLEGSILAYENGADVIELDIYLTTDNQVVIMHDSSTSRTCNGALTIESCTLAQLKNLYVNKGYESNATYKNCKIPTLEEYLQEFKGKDVRLFIEVKSSKEAIIPKTKELIDKYEMYDQISFITFNANQIKNLNKYYPGCTTGYLCYNVLDETDSQKDMLDVMKSIGATNSTLNPSKAGYGKNAINAALSRGIAIYPWTFTAKADYIASFMNGYSGLTGNDCRMLANLVKKIEVDYEKKDYYIDDVLTLESTSTKYNRTSSDATSRMKINMIDENGSIVTDNTIKFTKEGKVSFIVSLNFIIDASNEYTLYSDVITIDVKKVEEPKPTDPEPTDPEPTDPEPTDPEPTDPDPVNPEPDPKPNNTKTIIIICASSAVLVSVGSVSIILIKKRKKKII